MDVTICSLPLRKVFFMQGGGHLEKDWFGYWAGFYNGL